tara:strand:+ start:1248 stop:1418 length:171 start_codon:yes stop_codon:yes gene_type:complete
MAKMTKTQVKNSLEAIESKAKKIYMQGGKYSDLMTTRDMVDILKVIDRVKSRINKL